MRAIADGAQRRARSEPERLTRREREVLELIARGRSNKRIALELGISEKTVKTHVGHVLAKLGVTDRTQAALLAVQRTGLGRPAGQVLGPITAGNRDRARPTRGGMPLAIITGASRGLGLALARALARRGWALVLDARGARRARAGRARARRDHRSRGDPRRRRRRLAPRARSSTPPATTIDLLVNNASVLGPSPQPALADYPLAELERVYRVNVLAPLALAQLVAAADARRRPRSSTSPPTRRSSPTRAGAATAPRRRRSSSSSAILAAEHPALRVYAVDPGDMRTRMHQEAFPGEDISDRPPPEESVPGLLALIEGDAAERPLPRARAAGAERRA